MDNNTVRLAREDELDKVLELYLDLHEDSVPEDDDRRRTVWSHIMNDNNYNIIVKEVDGVLVSTCTCIIIPNLTRNLTPYAFVENVVTKEGYEGKGYARECLEYAEKLARENDCYTMKLMSGSPNQRTHDFYKSCGYSSEGKTAYVNKLKEIKVKYR